MKIHFTTLVWHGNFHNFVINAFTSLGHEVIFFDQGGTRREKFLQKIIARLPKVQHRLDRSLRERISARWARSVRKSKPDVVLLMDYATNIVPSAIVEVQRAGFRVFDWVSSPITENVAKDLLMVARFSNKVFVVDRLWMPPVIFQENECVDLPLAGEPDIFYPLLSEGKKYDVLFVGSFGESWDGFMRAYVLSKVAEKHRVAIFGHGVSYWLKYFPNLKPCIMKGAVLEAKALNETYNQAKIVINLHSASHRISLSARTYEIALSGAFQLIDDREDLHALFPKGSFVSYQSISELLSLIDHWLPRDREREAMVSKMRDAVLSRHTWAHRARKIVEYLEK